MHARRQPGAVMRVVDQLLAPHVTDALNAAAQDLPAQTVRVDHGADIGDADEVDDRPHAGLDVDFDFGERRHEAVSLAVTWQVVSRNAHQPAALVRGRSGLGHRVDFLRHFAAVVNAAERDRALRRLLPRQHHAAALADDAALVGVVAGRAAAKILGSNLGELLLEVHARRVVRAGMRIRRLAAGLNRRPWQSLRRVAPDNFGLLPREARDLADHARGVERRERTEIADALVDFELAVRSKDAETVDADRTGGVGADAHANAAHLAARRSEEHTSELQSQS